MKATVLKVIVFILFIGLLGLGCVKEESLSVCGVIDPINKLDWLRNLKTSLKENDDINSAEIILFRLNYTDYIYIQKSISSAHDFPNTIYDCEGNEKYICGGNQPIDNCSAFFSKAQKINTIWKKE